ncbi:MAG TPA: sialidase family protein [Marmoricola sp.]|nr:sialidase family protein [Marmoricola sp.]
MSVRRKRILAAMVAVGSLVSGAVGLATADAATPTSGTVSDTSGPVTWSGGPFLTANVTAQATGEPDCTVPGSCDDFALHVSAPAGYDTDHNLQIKVGWSNTAADFDVYLYDASGHLAATAASSADPETITVAPNTGDYVVRVVPFTPLGESYTATASMVTKPANPAPGTTTPPGFTDYPADPAIADPNGAGEPSIGFNPKTGATLYQAGLATLKAKFDDSTSPATATWSDVSANAAKGCPQGSTTSLDPILFTDRTTGRTFESQLSGVDSLTCWTDDDGATWLPSEGGGIPSGVDHQTVGGGPYSANGIGALPTSSYPNAIYYCSQDIATAFCAVSRDGGVTFGAGVPTYSLLDCGGIHGHVKVAPDGTAYLPNRSCGATAAVAVSEDNGTSWTVRNVPGTSASDADPSVGIGANGTVYFGSVGSDGVPAVAVSTDRGKTWTNGQQVGTNLGIKNAVFPTVVAGDDNRAAFAFLGTTTGGNYQDINTFQGVWHLYVATTYDGGKTWQTSDATPNDPVQIGSICTGGTTCGADRNLLDFIDVTMDDHGRIEVGFADGCTGSCVTGGPNTRTAYPTIARQSSGLTLLSAYDPPVATATKKAKKNR